MTVECTDGFNCKKVVNANGLVLGRGHQVVAGGMERNLRQEFSPMCVNEIDKCS